MTPESQLLEVLPDLPPEVQRLIQWRLKVLDMLRPEQIILDQGERTTIALAGRAWGKTFASSNEAIWRAARRAKQRLAFIAPTINDLQMTNFEGVSGIATICPEWLLAGGSLETAYNKSKLTIDFANGSQIRGFSAEKPGRLRGPEIDCALIDEACNITPKNWAELWSNTNLCLRKSASPRILIFTTPKPVEWLREMVKRDGEGVRLIKGKTTDNIALPPGYIEAMEAEFGGTRIALQEMHAEILDDVQGAMFKREEIEKARISWDDLPDLDTCIVAVDPSGTETGDVCGVVCIGKRGNHFYVLQDESMQASPAQWARKAVQLHDWQDCDRIVWESNFGADLVRETLRSAATQLHQERERSSSDLREKGVTAKRSKVARATPVSALCEQGRFHIVGDDCSELVQELCNFSWQYDRSQSGSPGRLDAVTIGVRHLQGRNTSGRSVVMGELGFGSI